MNNRDPLSYYFGHRDTIAAYFDEMAKNDRACSIKEGSTDLGVSVSDKFFSAEPYGIAFSSTVSTHDVVKFQKALSDTFAELEVDPIDSSILTTKPFQALKKYFPEKQPSQTVRSVFSTLTVPRQ